MIEYRITGKGGNTIMTKSRGVRGAAGGCAVAVANFYLLCLPVQSAAGMDDQKALKAKVQASYNGRLLMQGLWCLVSYLAPCFNVAAGVIPLLFPNILIYLRQAAGKNKS